MEDIKEFFSILFEMSLAIFIIIFGYAIWDNYNYEEFNIAKLSSETEEVQIMAENKKIYIRNIGKNNKEVKLVLKVDKNQLSKNQDFILKFDNKDYILEELEYGCDETYNYYDVTFISFDKYETKDFNYDIKTNDLINYEFITV